MNNPGKASLPVIKRLPKYYRYLRTLKNDGITSISSASWPPRWAPRPLRCGRISTASAT